MIKIILPRHLFQSVIGQALQNSVVVHQPQGNIMLSNSMLMLNTRTRIKDYASNVSFLKDLFHACNVGTISTFDKSCRQHLHKIRAKVHENTLCMVGQHYIAAAHQLSARLIQSLRCQTTLFNASILWQQAISSGVMITS